MIEIPEITKEILFNLKVDPTNPNVMTKEQIQSVANSIKKYGFLIPIIVNKDNVIIDGHQRKIAAEHLGMDEVPVIRLNVDKVDQKLLKQIMNKLKGVHNYDLDLEEYRVILEEQGNLDDLKKFVAMDDEYINNILRELEPKGQHTEEELDEVPEADTIKTDIQYGDIIQLGPHRIMCGDSTKKEDVDKLMDGKKADMVLTDPPYNADYHSLGNDKNLQEGILGDNLNDGEFNEFIDKFIYRIKENINPGTPLYIFCNWKDSYPRFYFKLIEHNINVSACIVWNKKSGGMGWQDYRYQYEFCIYGFELNKSHPWYGERTQTDIWDLNREARQKYEHPTQKPVELMAKPINNSSKINDLVLDLFLGSGSTLIACEQTGRICYGMELDNKYCQVIVNRYRRLYPDKEIKFLNREVNLKQEVI
jgi:DNA modification methylase